MSESLAPTETLSFICDIDMGHHLSVPAFPEKIIEDNGDVETLLPFSLKLLLPTRV